MLKRLLNNIDFIEGLALVVSVGMLILGLWLMP